MSDVADRAGVLAEVSFGGGEVATLTPEGWVCLRSETLAEDLNRLFGLNDPKYSGPANGRTGVAAAEALVKEFPKTARLFVPPDPYPLPPGRVY